MKVLLTGNLGYVGSVVSPFLRSRGHDVLGLDTGFYRDGLLTPADDAPTIACDVREYQGAELSRIDAVVHLAALSNDPTGDLDPKLTDEINHKASVRLAEMARKAGVRRFVFASSCSLYGLAGDAPVDESAAFNPQTAYARSKVDTEHGLASLANDAFSPVNLRFATAYGLSPRLRFDIVANNLTGWAVTTKQVRLMSDGSAWRPLVHVKDMARAVAAALEAPRDAIHKQAFNVGRDEENFRIRQIAETVRQITGCELSFAAGASADNRSYRVTFAKLRSRLTSLKLEEDLAGGIRVLYEALLRNKMDFDRFDSAMFVRLKRLNALSGDGQIDSSLRWPTPKAS